MYDAVVIGGGFYGTAIAIHLIKKRGFSKIALIERESDLLMRASYNNQARIHNGYHYPRSYSTSFRSRVNFPRFVQNYSSAIKQDFTKLYAIAKLNSKVTAKQFERFFFEIGSKLEPAPPSLSKIFEPRLIEKVFLAEEFTFDASQLRHSAKQELNESGIEIRLNMRVKSIRIIKNGLSVECDGKDSVAKLSTRFVFNCTYSGLNQFSGDFPATKTKLKQEITEIALVRPPLALNGLGITVMDGPFFSMLPFPTRDLHTLSHVRYTPHLHWEDSVGVDPYKKLSGYNRNTWVDRMIRDASRYIPGILDTQYVDSLFEVKTTLTKNEGDDGRPILFEQHPEMIRCYSILGGKIDNIYDILEKLDNESLINSP